VLVPEKGADDWQAQAIYHPYRCKRMTQIMEAQRRMWLRAGQQGHDARALQACMDTVAFGQMERYTAQ
jgi:hypothetical protein